MGDEKKLLDRLRRIHERQREIQTTYSEQMGALSDEVTALLAGDASIGDVLKRVEKHFDTAWAVRYAPGQVGRYIWNYGKDRPQWKRLIKMLGVEELERRVLNYMRDGDDFYVRARHPFALFITNVNRFASEQQARDFELQAPIVVDCRHQPPCTSDQEHTRKRMADMRAPA